MYSFILGFIAISFLSSSFLLNKKQNILIFQIVAQLFYSISYYLLNAMSGFAYSIINLLKVIFTALKEKYRFLNNNVPLFIFILIYSILGVYTYQDFYSLFIIVAVVVYTCMIWQGTVKEVRIAGLINAVLWLIYDTHCHGYAQMIGDILIFIITLITIIKDGKNDKGKIEITS